MEPDDPSPGFRWVERVLRFLPPQYRILFTVASAILATLVAATLAMTFASGNDPLLQNVVRYSIAALIISVTTAVITIIGIALHLLIRSYLCGD